MADLKVVDHHRKSPVTVLCWLMVKISNQSITFGSFRNLHV
jgi:hypothetical protein